jgi:hypothetical protein
VLTAALVHALADAARRAVIEAAGQLAHDDHVDAVDQSFLSGEESSSAGSCAPAADWRTRPALCECPSSLFRAASPAARYRTPAGRPRPSATHRLRARAFRSLRETACRSCGWRCRRAALRVNGQLCFHFSATTRSTRTASPGDFGADAVAGQHQYVQIHFQFRLISRAAGQLREACSTSGWRGPSSAISSFHQALLIVRQRRDFRVYTMSSSSPRQWKPRSSQRFFSAWRPLCLPSTSGFPARPPTSDP